MPAIENANQEVRRFPVGLLACLFMTVCVVVVARTERVTEIVPIRWDTAGDDFVADGLTPATLGIGSDRARTPESLLAHLRRLAATGDARHLRYARAELAEAREARGNAARLDVIEARLLQSEHRFDESAELLRRVLRARPTDAEGWLLLSDVLLRAGRVDESRRACLRLALAGAPALGHWCAVQALQSVGDYRQADETSLRLLPAVDGLPAAARRWALEVAAESAVGAGDPDRAIALYRRALALGESPLALRIALADALIDAGRHHEVTEILERDRNNLAARVRMAIAGRATGARLAQADVDDLDEALDRRRGDARHVARPRDAAVWALRYRGDPRAALELAQQNWDEQKGAEDSRLLRAAALAAGDGDAQVRLYEWQQRRRAGESS